MEMERLRNGVAASIRQHQQIRWSHGRWRVHMNMNRTERTYPRRRWWRRRRAAPCRERPGGCPSCCPWRSRDSRRSTPSPAAAAAPPFAFQFSALASGLRTDRGGEWSRGRKRERRRCRALYYWLHSRSLGRRAKREGGREGTRRERQVAGRRAPLDFQHGWK